MLSAILSWAATGAATLKAAAVALLVGLVLGGSMTYRITSRVYEGRIAKDQLAQSQGVVGSLIKANIRFAEQKKIIGVANEQARKDDVVIRDLQRKYKRVRLNTSNVCADSGHAASANSTGSGVASGTLYQPGARVVYPVENMLGYRQDVTDGFSECEELSKNMRRINLQLKALEVGK